MATETLLDLSTKTSHKFIKIDGQPYGLRNLSDFSLMERHLIRASGKALTEITKPENDGDEATPLIVKATQALHDSVLRILIDAEEIVGKLTDEQKLEVLNCFFEQAGLSPTTGKAKPSRMRRGSNGSTEDTPKTG